jgi:hypothetical protein
MKTFILHWLGSSEPETIKGYDIADAFRRAGYGDGALAALDYYEEDDFRDLMEQLENLAP